MSVPMNMDGPIRVLMTGGGTGGHVYPAIAIADAVRKQRPGAEIAFAGSRDRMEWQAVPRAGYPIHEVTVQGLERRLSARNLKLPFTLAKGLGQAWSLVRHFDADVVVGTGGYVALPVLLAARGQHVPVLIQEQNAHIGLTNRIASRFAARIHVAFEEALSQFPSSTATLSGNPVRPGLADGERSAALETFGLPADVRQVLLVFGGSLGSLALNNAMEQAVNALLARPDLGIIWQTGPRYHERVVSGLGDASERNGMRLSVRPYLDDMAAAYAAADLVLCRSGALTCSELLLTGTPSLLVPSPNVTEDHQTVNARSMIAAGAAEMMPEADLGPKLAERLMAMLDNKVGLARMGKAALAAARPSAADDIATDVVRLAEVSA